MAEENASTIDMMDDGEPSEENDEEEIEKAQIKAFTDTLQILARLVITFDIESIVLFVWIFFGGGGELMIENPYVFVATIVLACAIIALAGVTKIGWINY